MNKRPVQLHIGQLSVGSKVPIGRGTLASTVSHHLNRHILSQPERVGIQDRHIPEIRVRAHPSLGIDALGEHVAQQIFDQMGSD